MSALTPGDGVNNTPHPVTCACWKCRMDRKIDSALGELPEGPSQSGSGDEDKSVFTCSICGTQLDVDGVCWECTVNNHHIH